MWALTPGSQSSGNRMLFRRAAIYCMRFLKASLVAQMVKNPRAN